MKKAVFFDIDGTIWNEHMEIPESTIRAVRQLRENGHYAFLCSGRSRSNIRSKKLLEIGFDGVIAACGTHVDFHGDTVFERLLTVEELEHAVGVLKEFEIPMVLEGPRIIYVNDEDFKEDPYVNHLRMELGDDVKEIPKDFSKAAVNKLAAAKPGIDLPALREALGESFEVIAHVEHVLEINPAGFSKATGIEKVCEIFGVAIEDTYAFGDSANDIEMLSYVANGIAMGNATDDAKNVANYITNTLEDDGIYHGLRHFGLI